jgi:hypothetical protein
VDPQRTLGDWYHCVSLLAVEPLRWVPDLSRALLVPLVAWVAALACVQLAARSSGRARVDGWTLWLPLVAIAVVAVPVFIGTVSWISPRAVLLCVLPAAGALWIADPLYARERRLLGRIALVVLGVLAADFGGGLLRPLASKERIVAVARLAFLLGLLPLLAGWVVAHMPPGVRARHARAFRLALLAAPALVAGCSLDFGLRCRELPAHALLAALAAGLPALALSLLAAEVGRRLAPPDAGPVTDSPSVLTDDLAPLRVWVTLGAAGMAIAALALR